MADPRQLGLVIAALGLALAPANERPDVLIDRDGATAALRSDSGNLVCPPATAAGYSVDNWLLADGDECDAKAALEGTTFRCDLLGCHPRQLQATTQPTPISDRAAIQKNKNQ